MVAGTGTIGPRGADSVILLSGLLSFIKYIIPLINAHYNNRNGTVHFCGCQAFKSAGEKCHENKTDG